MYQIPPPLEVSFSLCSTSTRSPNLLFNLYDFTCLGWDLKDNFPASLVRNCFHVNCGVQHAILGTCSPKNLRNLTVVLRSLGERFNISEVFSETRRNTKEIGKWWLVVELIIPLHSWNMSLLVKLQRKVSKTMGNILNVLGEVLEAKVLYNCIDSWFECRGINHFAHGVSNLHYYILFDIQ